MAHSHYVLDLYFRENERSERLTREVLRIDAHSDAEALAEGLRVDGWKRTHHYDIRAIQTPARAAHKLIYSSPVAEVAPLDDAVPPTTIPLDDGATTAPPEGE